MKRDFLALVIEDEVYSLVNGLKGVITGFRYKARDQREPYYTSKNSANGVFVKFPAREKPLFIDQKQIGWRD